MKNKKIIDQKNVETKKKSKELEHVEEVKRNTQSACRDLMMEYGPLLILITFIVLIRVFICTPVRVSGSSMYPTLKNGDTMLLYKLTKKNRGIKRFDVIVIDTDSGDLIKRVIGLPGENVKYDVVKEGDMIISTLYINNKPVEEKFLEPDVAANTCASVFDICSKDGITLGKNQYYFMGDNRGVSKDSRLLGPVSFDKIKGTTKLIIFPFTRFGNIK